MTRVAALRSFVLSLLVALTMGVAPASAIDRAFTTFEAPDTTRLLAICRNREVDERIYALESAINLLNRKMERIEAAMAKTRDALSVERDPARRKVLVQEHLTLSHWKAEWMWYQFKLEGHLGYYRSFPDCGSEGSPPEWRGAPSKPTSIGSFTPLFGSYACVTADGQRAIADRVAINRELARKIDGKQAELEDAIRKLQELTSRRQGEGADADLLRGRIGFLLDAIAGDEGAIQYNNEYIRELEKVFPCPPPASQPPSTTPTPPPADNRQGSLPVPMGKCEAGVLAAVNAARADPSGYGQSLRGARGRFAEEARAFLADRAPVGALAADPRLMAAAKAHGEDLAAANQVGHRGSDGRGLMDRFRAQGLYATLTAEVIAIRQPTPAGAIRALVIDEGHPGGPHRKDLFNPRFTLAGIACVKTRSHGQLVIIDLSNAPMT